MKKRGTAFQIDLMTVAGQADDEQLRALLHLQKSLLLKNVEAHADFTAAVGAARVARDFAHETAKLLANDAVLCACRQIPPDCDKVLPLGDQPVELLRAQRLPLQMPAVERLAGAETRARLLVGANIQQIQLHGAKSAVFIDLRGVGDIDHISQRNRGKLCGIKSGIYDERTEDAGTFRCI